MIRRAGLGLGFLVLVAVMSAAVFSYAQRQALDQLAQRARADLALAADRVTGQLQRYQDLAVLLADNPTLRSGDRAAMRALLLEAADKTSALNIQYLDAAGAVVAEVQAGLGGAGPALIARAMQGALGTGHGVVPDGRRTYYFAAPEFGDSGRVRGVLVVAVDIDNVEWDWRGSRPVVFFTDARGVVFISNRSEILFWTRAGEGAGLRPRQGISTGFERRVIGPHEVWAVDWGAYIPARSLHLTKALPVIGMTAEALVDTGPAVRLARLQTAVFAALWLAFGALLFLATERRRTLAEANRLLEARVAARTAELKKAQADLVQAGKLSALGQMSAGISHELNQPLMAIQQYAENGAAFLERGKPEVAEQNLSRISALAGRAARIIKNLRAFARNESEPMGRVDLVKVIDAAVELTNVRLQRDGVALNWSPAQAGVFAYGGDVRLTQVFVNLINNAADAMAEQPREKVIGIEIKAGARLCVVVRDTGPGIADQERIFEPFYSTKEVGGDTEEGMGLGLSISYGLVQSFGGNIRGENAPGQGAVFTVELEYWHEEEKAA
ncbi:ATP-binding protein [Rhodobacteraceae bacterium D3-12]|nr:ATP-binding protein [Rhodobacteraceae bacterium D3-12]